MRAEGWRGAALLRILFSEFIVCATGGETIFREGDERVKNIDAEVGLLCKRRLLAVKRSSTILYVEKRDFSLYIVKYSFVL